MDAIQKLLEKINNPSKKNYISSFIISIAFSIIIHQILSNIIGILITLIFSSETLFSVFFVIKSPIIKCFALIITFKYAYSRFSKLNLNRIVYWLWIVAIINTNFINLMINYSQESKAYSDFQLISRIILEIACYIYAINYLRKYFSDKTN